MEFVSYGAMVDNLVLVMGAIMIVVNLGILWDAYREGY